MSRNDDGERRGGRRVRSLLDSYYALSDDKPKAATPRPGDIDSPAFEADMYLGKLMNESTLGELVNRRNEMATEIKTLDNDMQMLVYENYNKFIAATDTIRKMKDNVEDMEREMNRLTGNMDKISDNSEGINEKLGEGRSKIAHLSGIRNLLKKLQFLFELPGRLKKSVELEAYAQAVKYYSISTRALRQYSHLASFRAIQLEAEEIIDGLREQLRAKVLDENAPLAQSAEAVELLLSLKEESAGLRESYLKSRRVRIDRRLQQVVDSEAARREAGISDAPSSSPAKGKGTGSDNEDDDDEGQGEDQAQNMKKKKKKMRKVRRRVPKSSAHAGEDAGDGGNPFGGDDDDDDDTKARRKAMSAANPFADSDEDEEEEEHDYESVYETDDEASCEEEEEEEVVKGPVTSFVTFLTGQFISEFQDLARSYSRLFLASVEPQSDEYRSAASLFRECARDFFTVYFDLVMGRLHERMCEIPDLLAAMETVHTDVLRSHQICPEARLADRGTELVEKVMRQYIVQAFENLRKTLMEQLDNMNSLAESKTALGDCCSNTASSFVEETGSLLKQLQVLVTTQVPVLSSYTRGLIDHIHHETERAFTYFFEASLRFCEEKSGTEARTDSKKSNGFTRKSTTSQRDRREQEKREQETEEAARAALPSFTFTPHAAFPVLFTRVCLHLEGTGIRQMAQVVKELFPGKEDRRTLFDIGSVSFKAKDCAERTLSFFVDTEGQKVARMIRTSVENKNWLGVKREPRDVRPSATMAVQDLERIYDCVAQLFDDPAGRLNRAAGLAGASSTTSTSNLGVAPRRRENVRARTIESGIERLFAKKLEIFGPVQFNTLSILTGIIKIAVKTYLECVRLRTLGRFGFQQVQVDTQYLRACLIDLVDDPSLLETLLDEVITSGIDRCIDLDPQMDATIVDSLVAKARDKASAAA